MIERVREFERDKKKRVRKRRKRENERNEASPVLWRVGGWPNANPNLSAVFDQWSKGGLISGQRGT